MDSLLRGGNVDNLLRGPQRVRPSATRGEESGVLIPTFSSTSIACMLMTILQNRMMESLVLFDSVVNSRWFVRTSIILFLNKVDLFKVKLARSPLSNYFPDYSGGNDVNRAAKYLLWRFNQVNRAHLNLYPQ